MLTTINIYTLSAFIKLTVLVETVDSIASV